MENYHMAEQDYHMEYTSERQRETVGEDKPGLWLLTCSRAVSKQRQRNLTSSRPARIRPDWRACPSAP